MEHATLMLRADTIERGAVAAMMLHCRCVAAAPRCLRAAFLPCHYIVATMITLVDAAVSLTLPMPPLIDVAPLSLFFAIRHTPCYDTITPALMPP